MDPRKKREGRRRRRMHIRRKVHGTAERPRLAVYRSNRHIYAQLVDDDRGHTVVQASSLDDGVTDGDADKSAVAKKVGELVAERAKDAGVDAVVFDRAGFRYAGRIAALAEGARERGLHF